MNNAADRPAGRLPTRRPRSESTPAPSRDRRAGIERTIELSRWMVLIFAAVANNFPGLATGERRGFSQGEFESLFTLARQGIGELLILQKAAAYFARETGRLP